MFSFSVPHRLYPSIEEINSKTGYMAFAVVAALCQIRRRSVIYASGRQLASMVNIDHTSIEDGLHRLVESGIIAREGERITFLQHDFSKPWGRDNTQFYVPAILLDGSWYSRATMRVIRVVWYLLHSGLATEVFVRKNGIDGSTFYVCNLEPVAYSMQEVLLGVLKKAAFQEIFSVEPARDGVKNADRKVTIRIRRRHLVQKQDMLRQVVAVVKGDVERLLNQLFPGHRFTTEVVNEVADWAGTYGLNLMRRALEQLRTKYFLWRLRCGEIRSVSAYLHACVRGFALDPLATL